ncbi:SusC/RagA family TonB-linked outer membrane protein [Pedobacter insulae]|uniref:TonB-linked outer membrane protein, SusC/RagA family n=1 Tax=Pedobacter insulae TaxID=414048 RepID=A0A1I2V279_9SPHI|nr:TonB-dependent receptor [Pedobacter insulae]SFG81261.1 TonB-linked outer membrane protein, SusC/RagA family [Pedobacter insulae]
MNLFLPKFLKGKWHYLCFLLLFTSSFSYAQTVVTGTVKDEKGEILPRVGVKLKASTITTVSDIDGKYKIQVSKPTDTLIFSYIGYKQLEVPLEGRTNLNVSLVADNQVLGEVVVVGYGTQKKVNLTGAVSVVSSKDLTMRPVGQTSAALQGLAPGVTVTQNSGRPGGDAGTIRIRGIGTLNDANPLVLIDNVEGSLNNIDPNIIESVSILKDAASASIYGSRAANGVILVTTKRAKSKQLTVSYNSYAGVQKLTNLPDLVNAVDHMNLTNLAYTNTDRAPLFSNAVIENTRNRTNPDLYPDTDWQKEVLTGSGFMQNHFVTINGGGEKVRFLTSFGYFDQAGLLETSNFRRFTIRNNADMKFSDKLNMSIDVQINNRITKEPGRGSNSVFNQMNRIAPIFAGVFSNGNYGEGSNGNNPIAYSGPNGGLSKISNPGLLLNATLSYKPFNWLQADITVAPRYDQADEDVFVTAIKTYKADGTVAFTSPALASLDVTNSRSLYNNFRGTLTATKALSKHNFKLLAGASREDYTNNNLTASRTTFIFPDYPVLGTGSSATQLNNGSKSEWALQSVFGRFNYNFDERYLLEVNGRYDGSSRFAQGKRYGFFPSVSAGWRVSQEKFFQSLSSGIPEFKIRASWGKLGNQNIGTYPAISLIQLGAYSIGNQTYTVGALNDASNSNITWESTEMKDIGFDAVIFKKLNITFDYYERITTDILLKLDVPIITGQAPPFQNAGTVKNKGWELGLNYAGNVKEFKYSIGINFSDVKNKVTDLKGVNRTGITVSNEGYAINSLYGFEAIGYFASDAEVAASPVQFGAVKAGDIKYKDQNGDNKITDLDNVIIGNTIPRYTYSANINLAYKNLDLGIFLQGVGKANGYLYAQSVMPFFNGGTVQEMHKDNWNPQNTNAAFPRLAFGESNNEKTSSFWIKDASYLRLKNIQLGYKFSPEVIKKMGLKSVRIYANASNLFTFDKFWDGYDVEAPVGTGNIYPQVKVYNFGLDVNF